MRTIAYQRPGRRVLSISLLRDRTRPWWSYAALGTLAVLAAGLYTWGLSRNGMGNGYYAAVVKSGTLSWKAFLFGSLDPGSFITADKPPFAFWVQGLSARIFGFSSWSILLPQALAGVASVLIVYRLARVWAGEVAGMLAGLAMALSPVAVVMFRFNNPDALLTLLLLLAAWMLWSALEKGSAWKLAGVGAVMGLAFTTKMLEAFVVLPAFAAVYLVCGRQSLGRRFLHLLAAAGALLAAGSWWVAVVELWPKATRPYIGGSANNSVFDLVFSRTAGYFTAGAGAGPSLAGHVGWLRIFDAQMGGQISWLLPLALMGLLAGLWTTRRKPRTDRLRAGFVLWGMWTLLYIAVFSGAKGVLHPYYAIVLAPAIAMLVGGGCVALWQLSDCRRWLAWLLPAAIVGTAVWSATLLKRTPGYAPGLAWVIVAVACTAALILVLLLARLVTARSVAVGAVAVATGCLLAGPAAYSASTISRSVTGAFAGAGPLGGTQHQSQGVRPDDRLVASAGALRGLGGPSSSGRPAADAPAPAAGGGLPGGATGNDLAVDRSLIEYLEAHQGSAKYLVAVQGSAASVPLILATGKPVVTMGGFSGSDPTPTLAQLQAMVAMGSVHYVLLSGGGGFGVGGTRGAGPGGSLGDVYRWVAANGTIVSVNQYGGASSDGTLYYLP